MELTGKHTWTTNWKLTLWAQSIYYCHWGCTLKMNMHLKHINIPGKSGLFKDTRQRKDVQATWRGVNEIMELNDLKCFFFQFWQWSLSHLFTKSLFSEKCQAYFGMMSKNNKRSTISWLSHLSSRFFYLFILELSTVSFCVYQMEFAQLSWNCRCFEINLYDLYFKRNNRIFPTWLTNCNNTLSVKSSNSSWAHLNFTCGFF